MCGLRNNRFAIRTLEINLEVFEAFNPFDLSEVERPANMLCRRLLELLGDLATFYRSNRRIPQLIEKADDSNNCKYSAKESDSVEEIDICHNQSRLTLVC
jgi:hypothetical protein